MSSSKSKTPLPKLSKRTTKKWRELMDARDHYKAKCGIEIDERRLITNSLFPVIRQVLKAYRTGSDAKLWTALLALNTVSEHVGVWEEGRERKSMRRVTEYRENREKAKQAYRETGTTVAERTRALTEAIMGIEPPEESAGTLNGNSLLEDSQKKWKIL
jgi:hypothetical protein